MASRRRWAYAQSAAPRATGSVSPRNPALSKGPLLVGRSFSFGSGRDWRLERSEQDIGRRHRVVDTKHLEDFDVGRVVHTRDGLLDPEMLLRHLQGDEVVLVIGGDRKHCVRALDTGLRKELHLASVSAHDDAAELSLQPVGPPRVPLDEGDLVATLEQVARKVVTDRPAADDDYVHGRRT